MEIILKKIKFEQLLDYYCEYKIIPEVEGKTRLFPGNIKFY